MYVSKLANINPNLTVSEFESSFNNYDEKIGTVYNVFRTS
jgi:hypothetical protein